MGIEARDVHPVYPQAFFETLKKMVGYRKRPEKHVIAVRPLAEPRGEIIAPRDPRMPYGGRSVHFQGKNRGYELEHYMGAVYKYNRPLLQGIITNLNTSIFSIDPDQSREEVKRKMDASGANVMLFRPSGSDEFVGFAILRRMKIAGHWVLYVAERAIVEDHRREHLGRFVISEALHHYREDRHEPIEVIANKTQNAAAALSIIESEEIEGGLAPFQRRFTKDLELRKVLIGFYRSTRNHSSISLNPDTGLSRMEYSDGVNVAYTPDLRHRELMKIHNFMEKKLRLNRNEGDAVNCLGWTRPHMDAALGLSI